MSEVNLKRTKKFVSLRLEVGEQLTTISCGHVVAELLKFLAYQRLQIPYTYQWLKQIITQRKASHESNKTESLQSQKHFKTADSALQSLDYVLKSLLQEIGGPSMPDEVCITFGPTPMTCKEVYRIILPTLCHKPQCHSSLIAKDQKLQSNIFRTLATSAELTQAFSNSLTPTNMHIFIRKKVTNHLDAILNDHNFVPARGSRIPRTSQIVVIDFRSNSKLSCCHQFEIFGDNINSSISTDGDEANSVDDYEYLEIQSSDTEKWFQSTYVMKGFKDCVVNGNSVTNMWLA